MSVVEAVTRDIDVLRCHAPAVADSALAATALVLAAQLDDRSTSATSKSMCAKSLLDVMEQIRGLAPPVKEETELDKVRNRRAARRAGLPAS